MKLSIIIPVFNDAQHILRALKSVENQSCEGSSVECIVVDDASSDLSTSIVELFGETHDWLTLVKLQARSGPGGARNRGVAESTGDYILFLDSDDWLADTALSDITEAAKSSPDIILTGYSIITQRGKRRLQHEFSSIEEAANTGVGIMSKVIKREKYVKMPIGTISEDTAWHFLQIDACDTFANVKSGSIQYYYDKTNPNAISSTPEHIANNSYTLEQLAFSNMLITPGKNDKWVSDVLRNLANMYDIRNLIKKPGVLRAWRQRFTSEYQNIMTGHWIH